MLVNISVLLIVSFVLICVLQYRLSVLETKAAQLRRDVDALLAHHEEEQELLAKTSGVASIIEAANEC